MAAGSGGFCCWHCTSSGLQAGGSAFAIGASAMMAPAAAPSRRVAAVVMGFGMWLLLDGNVKRPMWALAAHIGSAPRSPQCRLLTSIHISCLGNQYQRTPLENIAADQGID